MPTDIHRKVRAEHLERDAFLYVRQSTLRQVMKNVESTKRQYALRDRAVALGWPIERVHTIDDDLGQRATGAQHRDGFQQLVSEVAIGRAGLIVGLEVSRLARNNADWQRLLELCALSGCLVADEDGVYDPAHFNDRLLLGLKGAISEAEQHVLTARLVGGQRSKARRGELEIPLPVGLVYDATGAVVLDPDPRVQTSVRLLFDIFRESHSAAAVAARFRREGRQFPRRIRGGANHGKLLFASLDATRVATMLHNPRYAGAYVYGRRPGVYQPQSRQKVQQSVPRKDWQVLILGAHPGYITWEEFESNERVLDSNYAQSPLRRSTARGPREHEALLMGCVLCGACGAQMHVSEGVRGGGAIRYYMCASIDRVDGCHRIGAPEVDEAIGALLLQTLTPSALQSALAVQDEVTRNLERMESMRRQELERARHSADVKRRRFLGCDPDHRLVADQLEADWNESLRHLDHLQQQHERQRCSDQAKIEGGARAKLLSLAQEFSHVWNDNEVDSRERRRLLTQLIDDVTLINGDAISAHVRWRGGRISSLTIRKPDRAASKAHTTSREVVEALDRLLETCTDCEAARRLNAQGHRTWQGQLFDNQKVERLRSAYGLKSCRERWLAKGYLTAEQIASQLGISVAMARMLGRDGRLPYRDAGYGCVFEPLNGASLARDGSGRYYLKRPLPTEASGISGVSRKRTR
jgi:DNA invertase Pin-like site-specific DNA recombinase